MTFLVEKAADLFESVLGTRPSGVWSAPGRVNLIGEHTDYNEGFAMPLAINRRTAVAAALRDDRRIRVTSSFDSSLVEIEIDDISADTVSGWSAYPLGVVWALRQVAASPEPLCGVDLVIDSDVPVGAGLSSSAALECAVAVALNDLWQMGLSPMELARIGQKAENDIVGAPTGLMDQIASMHGRADHAVLIDCQALTATPVALGFAASDLVLLVIDTTVRHSHATGGYKDRRASCERACEALGVSSLRSVTESDLPRAQAILDAETYRRVRHVVTENARVLETGAAIAADGPRAVGELLNASHVSMRDDYEISIPELDCAVEAAQNAGAVGARMTGGGFGGAAIALVSTHLMDEVTEAVLADFAHRGFARPEIFAVSAADGARRDY